MCWVGSSLGAAVAEAAAAFDQEMSETGVVADSHMVAEIASSETAASGMPGELAEGRILVAAGILAGERILASAVAEIHKVVAVVAPKSALNMHLMRYEVDVLTDAYTGFMLGCQLPGI